MIYEHTKRDYVWKMKKKSVNGNVRTGKCTYIGKSSYLQEADNHKSKSILYYRREYILEKKKDGKTCFQDL